MSISSLYSRLRRCLVLCSLSCLVNPAPAAASQHDGYQFSPVNQYGIALTAEFWNPIIQYVYERSGVKLSLRIGRTSAETTALVLAKEVDFVFSNHLFSPEREQLGWKVFGRRDAPAVRGQIVVESSSPITDLSQLAGKTVVFPGPEATISYRFTYNELLNRKVDNQVSFAGNTDAALVQLFSGRAAAAGVNSQLVAGYAKREGKNYRVLWETEPLHDLALMASSRVPAKEVAAVARAFAGMHEDPVGKEILRVASAKVKMATEFRFVQSDGKEYDPYRRFYQTMHPRVR